MPSRPHPTSGYEQLAHDADLSDNDDDESSALVPNATRIISIQPQPSSSMPNGPSRSSHTRPHVGRGRSNSAIDITVINARLERWADQIANKFKFKKDSSKHEHPPLEILHSVFSVPDGYSAPAVAESDLVEAADDAQLTREKFDETVEAVRTAISKGIDPKLIKQGSSGSYFMRDSDGKIVGVFKPKDEEPYVMISDTLVWASFLSNFSVGY